MTLRYCLFAVVRWTQSINIYQSFSLTCFIIRVRRENNKSRDNRNRGNASNIRDASNSRDARNCRYYRDFNAATSGSIEAAVRRADRLLGVFSSRRIGIPPPPHLQASVPPPPLWFGARDTFVCGRARGWQGPISDEVTDTVVLKEYMYFEQQWQQEHHGELHRQRTPITAGM